MSKTIEAVVFRAEPDALISGRSKRYNVARAFLLV
jgi:hypothetical protein